MSFLRQQGIVNPDLLARTSVTIVGSGAIGSFTALALSKMGVKRLTLFDKDEVELHNISNQFFPADSLGKAKAAVTLEECIRFCPEKGTEFEARHEFYKDQPLNSEIVIAATDNIEGRAAAFKASQASQNTMLFLDGRMGAELLRLFALDPKDISLSKRYFNDYLDGVSNSAEPCTARTIIYNVLVASGLIASMVKKFVNNEVLPFQYTFHFKDFYQIVEKV